MTIRQERTEDGGAGEEGMGLVACVVSAMVMTALADGRLTYEEKDMIVQFVGTYKKDSMTPPEILQLAEGTISRLREMGQDDWGVVLSQGRHLAAEDKRKVLDAAAAMALVDGDLHDEERALLGKIGAWLGVETAAFDAWVVGFQAQAGEPEAAPPGLDPGEGPFFPKAMEMLASGASALGVGLLENGVTAGEELCMNYLANLHIYGEHGVALDARRATELFERAVAATNIDATFFYGLALFDGKVLRRDKKKGLYLVKKAALMNQALAQDFLSGYFGRRLRLTKAAAWCILSADNGHEEARELADQAPPAARALAEKLAGGIAALQQLALLDANACLARLEEMVTEI